MLSKHAADKPDNAPLAKRSRQGLQCYSLAALLSQQKGAFEGLAMDNIVHIASFLLGLDRQNLALTCKFCYGVAWLSGKTLVRLKSSEATPPFCASVLCDDDSARCVTRIVASRAEVADSPLHRFPNLRSLQLSGCTAWSQLLDVCVGATSLTSIFCVMARGMQAGIKFPANSLAAALPKLRSLRLTCGKKSLLVTDLSLFTCLTDLELLSAGEVTKMPPTLRRLSGKAVGDLQGRLLPPRLEVLRADSVSDFHLLQNLRNVDVADWFTFDAFLRLRSLRRFSAWGINPRDTCITTLLLAWPSTMEEFSVKHPIGQIYSLELSEIQKLTSLTTYAYPCFGGSGARDMKVWKLAKSYNLRMPRLREVVRAPHAFFDKDSLPVPPEKLMHKGKLWPNLNKIDIVWRGRPDVSKWLPALTKVQRLTLMVLKLADIDYDTLQSRYPNLRVLEIHLLYSKLQFSPEGDNAPDGIEQLTNLKHLQCLHLTGLREGAQATKMLGNAVREALQGSAICVCDS